MVFNKDVNCEYLCHRVSAFHMLVFFFLHLSFEVRLRVRHVFVDNNAYLVSLCRCKLALSNKWES